MDSESCGTKVGDSYAEGSKVSLDSAKRKDSSQKSTGEIPIDL
jgi:hypothetical protein